MGALEGEKDDNDGVVEGDDDGVVEGDDDGVLEGDNDGALEGDDDSVLFQTKMHYRTYSKNTKTNICEIKNDMNT